MVGARWGARALVMAWLAFPLAGTTPGARVLDRLEQAVTRPLPAAPAPEVRRPDRVWVPDRYVPAPAGLLHVPGHWEQRLTGGDVHVPPLIVCGTGTGECVLVPAGTRPPADIRQGP
ncbi:MAG: hypothetical protein ACREJ9_10920 [Candidatus Rokuibacteriota bacterium]